MSGSRIRLLFALAVSAALAVATTVVRPAYTAPSEAPPSAEQPSEPRGLHDDATPAQLFAAVEEAWSSGDAEALGALVDTTNVRIGLKPGEQPTAAMTRSAAAFLFQDQLRLVATHSFVIQRIQVDKSSSSASARWTGDWGGRQGVRRLTVTMRANPVGGRWLLREVRVKG